MHHGRDTVVLQEFVRVLAYWPDSYLKRHSSYACRSADPHRCSQGGCGAGTEGRHGHTGSERHDCDCLGSALVHGLHL